MCRYIGGSRRTTPTKAELKLIESVKDNMSKIYLIY